MTALNNSVAVITGGSMGLGKALAGILLQRGWSIALCARNESRLQDTVRQLSGFGTVKGYTGDVANPAFQSGFVNAVIQDFGRIDAFVNNASILGDLPMPAVADTTLDNLRHVFESNVIAPIGLLQHALPHLRRRPASLAISISSDAAVAGYPGWGVYGASKAALDLLHKTLAAEQDGSGNPLTLYQIDPGDMDTAMHHAASPGDEGLASPDSVAMTLAGLFDELQTMSFRFPSGARLQVQGDRLAAKEVV